MSMVEPRVHLPQTNEDSSTTVTATNVAVAPVAQDTTKTTRWEKKGIIITRNRTIAIVAITAVFAGAMLVVVLYLLGSAILNANLLAKRDASINDFRQVQENVEKLRNNVTSLENDDRLEYLAPAKSSICYDDSGKEITDYKNNMELVQNCSALRTLNSAMPASNRLEEEKLITYITKLVMSGNNKTEIKSIGMDRGKKYKYDNEFGSGIKGVGINLDIVSSVAGINELFVNFDKSVRFLRWEDYTLTSIGNGKIQLKGMISAYYVTGVSVDIKEETLKMGLTGLIWNNFKKDGS